jgi:hypothetical protein
MPGIPHRPRNHLGAKDLVPCLHFETRNPIMAGLFANDSEQIDRRTSRSICDAVGERLQQSLRPDPQLPTHLEQLLDELKRRERDSH